MLKKVFSSLTLPLALCFQKNWYLVLERCRRLRFCVYVCVGASFGPGMLPQALLYENEGFYSWIVATGAFFVGISILYAI